VLNIHYLLQERRYVWRFAAPLPRVRQVATARGNCVRALISGPAAPRPVFSDRFQLHPHLKALLKPASRTLFPCCNCNWALSSSQAHIVLLVLDSPLEESFARLTGENAVVEPRDLVSAHRAGRVDELLPGDTRLSGKSRMLISIISCFTTTSRFLVMPAKYHSMGVKGKRQVAGVPGEWGGRKRWGREARMVVRVTRRGHR